MLLQTITFSEPAANRSIDSLVPAYSIYVSSTHTLVFAGTDRSNASNFSRGINWPVGLFGFTSTTKSYPSEHAAFRRSRFTVKSFAADNVSRSVVQPITRSRTCAYSPYV